MNIKDTKSNRIQFGGQRLYHLDYIKLMAAKLPQFEGINHYNKMKRIYRIHGHKAMMEYVNFQYIIMRSVQRKQSKYKAMRVFWDWFYEVIYNI